MSEIRIEPLVPIPDKKRRSKIRDTVRTMNVGDSVLLRMGQALTVRKHMKAFGMGNTSRKEGELVRVWRTS